MAESTHSNDEHAGSKGNLSNGARFWYGLGGVLFLILAALAFAIPVAATFAANIWLAVLLIVGGIFEIIGAFRRHEGLGAAGEAIFGVVTVLAGVVAVIFPMMGVFAFTVAMIGFFIVSGVARLYQGLRRRPERAWIFNVLSGLISIGLGVFLIFWMPQAALVTLGILLAADFTFFAVALLMTAIYGEKPAIYRPDMPA